jgi:hypothetical protein
MEREQATLHALIRYLVEHGYPLESMAMEYPAGRRRADLVLVDTDTQELTAVFELKRKRTPQSENLGRAQLLSYLEAAGNPAIPAYLVFPGTGDLPFDFELVTPDEPQLAEEQTEGDILPEYTVLRESRRSTVVAEKKIKKKNALDGFVIACWVCGALTAIALGLDVFTEFEMSETRIALLGGTVAFIIIPFAKKLKILGVEIER